MFVVALTGNYGMGKSSVASMFSKCGAVTLDSDAIVADLLQKNEVADKIRKLLGPAVLNADHQLNKRAVADIIFNNAALRRKIEALLHPLVFDALEASIRKIDSDEEVVVVEVPLLFESGIHKRFDRTIAVFTNQRTALGRLKKKGVSRRDALSRLKAQMDIRQKKRLADYVIDNNGTKRQVMPQVRKIYNALLEDYNQKAHCCGDDQQRNDAFW